MAGEDRGAHEATDEGEVQEGELECRVFFRRFIFPEGMTERDRQEQVDAKRAGTEPTEGLDIGDDQHRTDELGDNHHRCDEARNGQAVALDDLRPRTEIEQPEETAAPEQRRQYDSREYEKELACKESMNDNRHYGFRDVRLGL